MAYQLRLRAEDGAFDIPWGIDECMLAAFALGGQGAVGSTYNFAAPVFQRLFAAFARGDLATAREQQRRGTTLIQLLMGYGYLPASKVIMKWLGVDVGACRSRWEISAPNKRRNCGRSWRLARFFSGRKAEAASKQPLVIS